MQPLTGEPEVYESNAPPPIPGNFTGTLPEWRVFWWLTKRGIAFDFQSSLMGGRAQLGGLVVDFLITSTVPTTALRVQGEAFHYGYYAKPGRDQMQKDILENEFGFKVIDLDESDLLNRLDFVMGLAMRGIDISKAMWSR